MKRIHEPNYVADRGLVLEALDFRASAVEVPCPHCGRHVYLTEALINARQALEIEAVLAEMSASIQLAFEDTYGGDPRHDMLIRNLAKRLREVGRPKLKVVK